MEIVRTPHLAPARLVTPEEVADTELGGIWVVDVRSEPRSPVRAGWLVDFEDDIVFLTDGPQAVAHRAWDWPVDAA